MPLKSILLFICAKLGLDELIPSNLLNIFDQHFNYKNNGMSESDRYSQMFYHIKKNKFIISSYNNDRLVSQSGAFLFPGFDVVIDNSDNSRSRISPGAKDLKLEFQEMFIIPFDKKESILEELDRLNINEALLFPELEHKLRYIKYKHQSLKNGVSFYPMFSSCIVKDFSHYSGYKCPKSISPISKMIGVHGKSIALISMSPEKFASIINFPLRNDKINKHMDYIILNEIALVSNRTLFLDKIKKLFSNVSENWYENTSEVIKLKDEIGEILIDCGYSLEIRNQKAENIVLNIITSLKTAPI